MSLPVATPPHLLAFTLPLPPSWLVGSYSKEDLPVQGYFTLTSDQPLRYLDMVQKILEPIPSFTLS